MKSSRLPRAIALVLACLFGVASTAHAVPAEDDVATLDPLSAVIEALEAGDDAAYDDAVDELESSGAWIPAAGGHMLANRKLDGLTVVWLALDADETGLLRLATDTISDERDAIVFGLEGESVGAVQDTDLANAVVLQVMDRRGIDVPDLVRTVMTVNPRPGQDGNRPRPALFDDAIREISTLISTPAAAEDTTGQQGSLSADAGESTAPGWPIEALGGSVLAVLLASILLVRWRRRDGQLEGLAFTDGLTGLNNRRRLDSDVEAAKQTADRPTTVLMIDVDHFKEFNDRHGHRGGDEALRRVGAAISDSLRQGDVAYRYGGEEFCVILKDTDADLAADVAERLRATIAAAPIRLDDGSLHSVTASIGLARGRAAGIDDLITTADHAMYAAKQAGRNQLAIA